MSLDPGKWQWAERPNAVPEACILCTAQRHPRGFLRATSLNRPGIGATWFCAGCFEPAAEALGMLSVPNVAVLHGQLEEMSVANEELAARLEEAKANMSVPLADVIDFVAERAKRRPEPEPAGKAS